MCTTHYTTYTNCSHRTSRQEKCAGSFQGPATCTSAVKVNTKGGLVCPACYEQLVWVRSDDEWEFIEIPEGDLGKDDWVLVERVGYDWLDESEDKTAKDRAGGQKQNFSPDSGEDTKKKSQRVGG